MAYTGCESCGRSNLLREGPPLGIHVLAWCDSLTNLQRAIERQGLRDFALRVLFQMSTTDSSHLLDSPIANKLARNRALYMEDGWEKPEKFRPFGVPSVNWLKELQLPRIETVNSAAPAAAAEEPVATEGSTAPAAD